jgi:hypothetical protein
MERRRMKGVFTGYQNKLKKRVRELDVENGLLRLRISELEDKLEQLRRNK